MGQKKRIAGGKKNRWKKKSKIGAALRITENCTSIKNVTSQR